MTSILLDASAPAVLEALDRHERETSATYARALGGYVEDRPDMLVYITGLPAHFANGVKAPRLAEATVEESIDHVTDLLRSAGDAGTGLLGPLATPADLGERLERRGIHSIYDLEILSADIDAMELEGPEPQDLVIRCVTDEQDHAQWLRAMEDGFEMEEGDTRTIDTTARAVGFDPAGPWVRFVGLTDSGVAASSGLMLFGGLAGIYNVATVPGVRRRGYGTAMTRAALRHARDLGYRIAILGASAMGRGIYVGLGFRDLAIVQQYVYQPDDS